MIAIIDYGVGNLFSLQSSFAAIGKEAVVSSDKDVLRQADRLILPGVGAFADAAEKLRAAGMVKLEAGSIQGKNGSLFFGLFFGLFLVLLGAGCKRCQGQNDCKIAERFHGALKYCPLQIYKNI